MTPKQFQKFIDRDGGGCVHCGITDGLVPHHRANRGMGGSKARDVPANIVTMCAFNTLMESDPDAAAFARDKGWKISTHDDPELVAVFNVNFGKFVMLTNRG